MPVRPRVRITLAIHLPRALRLVPLVRLLTAGLLPLLTGCISYTVGQGAETAPVGERVSSTSLNIVPGTLDDSVPMRRPSVDNEIRYGLDERTDIGFRVATWSGFMLTWKHQLTRADTARTPENRARTSIMLGGGILNMGEHAGLEATLIRSGKWSPTGQLYGALRATQVIPITSSAVQDDPVFGASVGYLIGDRNHSIGPEIGVFYDRSVLGLNDRRVIVVPSVVVRASGLQGLRGLFPF